MRDLTKPGHCKPLEKAILRGLEALTEAELVTMTDEEIAGYLGLKGIHVKPFHIAFLRLPDGGSIPEALRYKRLAEYVNSVRLSTKREMKLSFDATIQGMKDIPGVAIERLEKMEAKLEKIRLKIRSTRKILEEAECDLLDAYAHRLGDGRLEGGQWYVEDDA